MRDIIRISCLFILAGFVPPAHADFVQTADGRTHGAISVGEKTISIQGKPVPWSEILYLSLSPKVKKPPPAHRVRLRHGESWRVELQSLEANKLQIRSALLGSAQVPMDHVTGLEFRPELVRRTFQAGHLHRIRGEPIPGTLLDLSEKTLKIRCVLGELPLARKGLVAYLMPAVPLPPFPPRVDEVLLADGSRLLGNLKPGKERAHLKHPLLGDRTLPMAAIRSVVRHRPGFIDLTLHPPQEAHTRPLIATGKQPARIWNVHASNVGDKNKSWIKGIRIEPHTTVRFDLPTSQKRKRIFRTHLRTPRGVRGSMRVHIRVGENKLWDGKVSPGEKPQSLRLTLPGNAKKLTVEVAFAAPVRFPCAMLFTEPHLVPGP